MTEVAKSFVNGIERIMKRHAWHLDCYHNGVTQKLRPRLLCVDDDPLFCDLLRRFFAPDFHVLTESNAVLALLRMRVFKPDVIILDVNMPKKSGLEIARQMRQEPWLKYRPLIFFSGMKDMADQALQAGAGGPTEFLVKGVLLADLDKAVRRIAAERMRAEQCQEHERAGRTGIAMCPETRLGASGTGPIFSTATHRWAD